MACGFSSLAMMGTDFPNSRIRLFASRMSSAERTKESATDIDSVLQTELEVELVFFGQRGDRHGRAGQIDALLLSEHAAVQDFAFHIVAANRARL